MCTPSASQFLTRLHNTNHLCAGCMSLFQFQPKSWMLRRQSQRKMFPPKMFHIHQLPYRRKIPEKHLVNCARRDHDLILTFCKPSMITIEVFFWSSATQTHKVAHPLEGLCKTKCDLGYKSRINSTSIERFKFSVCVSSERCDISLSWKLCLLPKSWNHLHKSFCWHPNGTTPERH